MSENAEIKLFRLAKTSVDREQVAAWMEWLGANEFEIPEDDVISDPALLIALAAKRCYNSFQTGINPNVTRIRKDWVTYIDNILASGHGSVLEHSTYTYAIENISRVFTAEMNRHRAGVGISEGSLRYIRLDPQYKTIDGVKTRIPNTGMKWWMPNSLRESSKTLPDGSVNPAWNEEFEHKKELTREIFKEHWDMTEKNYERLMEVWKDELDEKSPFAAKKKLTSCFRRIVGMGIATGGVWTMNMRAVRHVISMRASEGAEEEIAYVYSMIAKDIVASEPMLLGDIKQDDNGFWTPKYWKV